MAAGGDSLCPQCRQGTAADHQQGADDAEEGEFFAIDESRLPHGENLHEVPVLVEEPSVGPSLPSNGLVGELDLLRDAPDRILRSQALDAVEDAALLERGRP